MKGEEYFKKLIMGGNLSVIDSLVFFILRQVSFLYSLAMIIRVILYRIGIFRVYSLPKPVISVGNLVVGGTGKTPVTLWIASYLMNCGHKVAVLTRGYGGRFEGEVAVVSDGKKRLLSAEDAGDEPALLADLLPGLIVVMGSDRYKAGCLAMEKFSPDIFILDDGFQHIRLKRDLNILLLDAEKPLGNGRVFPAGTLREPALASKRADVAIFTRCDERTNPAAIGNEATIQLRAAHKLTGFRQTVAGDVSNFSGLAAKRGIAFAGIADPDKFYTSLEQVGLKLVATLSFPDHTKYGEGETAALAKLRLSTRAEYLITTAKDAVKLGSVLDESIPFYIAALEIDFFEKDLFEKALDNLILSR